MILLWHLGYESHITSDMKLQTDKIAKSRIFNKIWRFREIDVFRGEWSEITDNNVKSKSVTCVLCVLTILNSKQICVNDNIIICKRLARVEKDITFLVKVRYYF